PGGRPRPERHPRWAAAGLRRRTGDPVQLQEPADPPRRAPARSSRPARSQFVDSGGAGAHV
ncbi:MAG: hypothetical protein ABF330_00300, partial [Lentimonas sp.]